MASPSELSLDCKPHSYSMLLKSFGDHQQQYPDQTLKLEDFLSRLEEERVKIDAFKRELPLCMQLLTNAVESSRQQLQAYRGNNNTAVNQGPTRPILEEFIPLKTSNSEVSEKTTNTSDKANWMTSAQLWSQNSTTTITHQENATKQLIQSTTTGVINKTKDHQSPQNDRISFNVMSPKLTLDTKIQRNNGGGAFLPFSKDRAASCPRALPELALAALAEKEGALEDKKSCLESNIICGTNNNGNNNNNGVVVIEQGKGVVNNLPEGQTNSNVANNNPNNNNNNSTTNGSITQTSNNNNNNNTNNNQTHRKARRCWSPDLHRRFVSALQMLGGSQVATPKQIRELMKVEGLTNDEVKSHLQKYRLHTRRPSPSPQAAGGPAPQLVVLGGIWVPPEYTHGAGPTAAALYSPHAPPHYCGPPPPVPQDHFYSTGPPLAHHHHHSQLIHDHHHHQQLHVYNKGSPESEVRGGPRGDRSSESIEEDGKSESSSWNKADSGERKGLAALRDDVADQESNGSEITLKF